MLRGAASCRAAAHAADRRPLSLPCSHLSLCRCFRWQGSMIATLHPPDTARRWETRLDTACRPPARGWPLVEAVGGGCGGRAADGEGAGVGGGGLPIHISGSLGILCVAGQGHLLRPGIWIQLAHTRPVEAGQHPRPVAHAGEWQWRIPSRCALPVLTAVGRRRQSPPRFLL